MEDKKSLLKKLQVLAERGEAGEREAAEAALERLTKKYSITIDELDTEEVKVFEFEFHGDDEKQVLIQIAWKGTNSLGKYSLQGTTQGRYLTGGVPPDTYPV